MRHRAARLYWRAHIWCRCRAWRHGGAISDSRLQPWRQDKCHALAALAWATL